MGRNYYLYIAVTLTVAITTGSLISIKDVGLTQMHISDKIVHSGAYFMLALSWFLTFKNKFKSLKQYILIATSVFFYGIIIEICQAVFTKYRQADIYDMLANLVGISIALLLFAIIIRKKQMN